jgi:hypothetical protein
MTQRAAVDKSVSGAVVLLDFHKAYDSLSRKFLFQALFAMGFGPLFVSAIRILHMDTVAHVFVNQEISASFAVNSGVKQGMSPGSPPLCSYH